MDCRNQRAKVRTERVKRNGGSHTSAEWKLLLPNSPTCAICAKRWSEIPTHPDPRYKHTWTKGHKVSIYHGGSGEISNIQVECNQCNFKKNAGAFGTKPPKITKPIAEHKETNTVTTLQETISRKFSFILNNGTEIFPVQMKRRSTGAIAFRVSPGGKGANTLEASEEVNEKTMARKVIVEGYAVRCKSLDGNTSGLYKHGHRSVREIRLNTTEDSHLVGTPTPTVILSGS